MADNIAFLDSKIDGYKREIDHMKKVMDGTLDSATEQKIRSERQHCVNEMMNYMEMREAIAG